MAEVLVDWRTILVAALLALLQALVLALVSLGRLVRGRETALAGGRTMAGTRASARTRRLAVATQLALSLVLLIGTSLLVRSFMRILSADRGYRTDHVLSFTTWVYDEYPTPPLREQYVRAVLGRLGSFPGVRSVSVGSALPLADEITGETADVVMEGAAVTPGNEPQARGIAIWPSWIETLGIALKSGRVFTQADDARGEPVVLVNEAFVRRFSPDRDPVGRMLAVGLMSRTVPRRIIGVVADTRHARLDGPAEPGVFIPWLQQPVGALTFIVRSDVDPAQILSAVPRAMLDIDSRIGIGRLGTMDALLDQRLRERRFLIVLLGAFASIAVVIACVGVFGVMSQMVAERSREIGVRMALGASPRTIVGQFITEAGWMTAAGLIAGVGVASISTRFITQFLFDVARFDALALGSAVAMLLVFALLAAIAPTLRAARTDPAVVLQED
jgi:putative ABC transport system permease protein